MAPSYGTPPEWFATSNAAPVAGDVFDAAQPHPEVLAIQKVEERRELFQEARIVAMVWRMLQRAGSVRCIARPHGRVQRRHRGTEGGGRQVVVHAVVYSGAPPRKPSRASAAWKSAGGSATEIDPLTGDGVVETQRGGMQHHSFRGQHPATAGQQITRVHRVADHRMARLRQVNADLVGTPGLQSHATIGRGRQPFQYFDVGHRVLPRRWTRALPGALFAGGAAQAIAAIGNEARFNPATSHGAVRDRQVGARRQMTLKNLV